MDMALESNRQKAPNPPKPVKSMNKKETNEIVERNGEDDKSSNEGTSLFSSSSFVESKKHVWGYNLRKSVKSMIIDWSWTPPAASCA